VIRATFLIFPHLQRCWKDSKFALSGENSINYTLSHTHYLRSPSVKRFCENKMTVKHQQQGSSMSEHLTAIMAREVKWSRKIYEVEPMTGHGQYSLQSRTSLTLPNCSSSPLEVDSPSMIIHGRTILVYREVGSVQLPSQSVKNRHKKVLKQTIGFKELV
jgi:hypothetical protein